MYINEVYSSNCTNRYSELDALSDNALMLKVRDGDIDKMGLLFERHNRQLYRFIFHITGNKVLSEDMVQNVFFRMLKYRKDFTGTGEFRTWMYFIARNAMHDHFRKQNKMPSYNGSYDLAEMIPADHSADGQLLKEQELKTLERALKNLSDDNRELLVLYRYQDLTYRDIAVILKTTEGAIKVRIHRALNQLRENYLKMEK